MSGQNPNAFQGAAITGLIAAVIVVVGSFGPWATLGLLSVAGTDGANDGIFTLILGIAAAVLIAPTAFNPGLVMYWRGALAFLAFGVSAGIAVWDLSKLNDTLDVEFFGQAIELDPGWGLIAVAFAGVIGAIAIAIYGWRVAAQEIDEPV